MLYVLSCFFRDLPVAGDVSMSEMCARKLKALTRPALVTLRDAALDLVRIVDLAIGAKDEIAERVERFERRGFTFDPQGPRLAECPYCDTLTQYASDHSCAGLSSESADPMTDR